MKRIKAAIKWMFYDTHLTYKARQYAADPHYYNFYKEHEGQTESEFRDGWYFVGVALGLIALVVGIVMFCMTADRSACRDKARIKGIDYEWSVWAGCVYPSEERDDETHTIEIV